MQAGVESNQGVTGTVVDLSIVVPVYGCRDCLRALHARLKPVLSSLGTHEIVLVDDRSPDDAWQLIEDLVAQDPAVRGLRLSRNFGQHAAITAGLAHATGQRIVVMDCDLQDPPEEIPRLIRKADEGYDIVFARRSEKKQSSFRRHAAAAFFHLLNLASGTNLDGAYGSFSVISRKVADAYLTLNDRDRHYLFILNWLGFRHAEIEYEHADRHQGRSAYTLRALVEHALNGVFFQTTSLLRLIVYAGFFISGTGALLAAYFVYLYFAHSIYPGWTSLAVLLLVIGGFIILSTGIAGLYVGKIFEQVKGRPLYVVDRLTGGPNR